MWLCRCDCGKEFVTLGKSLRSGLTKSCGCYSHSLRVKESTTHGLSHERLYRVWVDMKKRCYDPAFKYYKNYGGRGIAVCDEWRNDYISFRTWAMENGYDPFAPKGLCTIDRIDVNGDYSPENCRWVDMYEQGQNKTNNRIVNYLGEEMTISRAASLAGVKEGTLWNKVFYDGLSVEEAVKKIKSI